MINDNFEWDEAKATGNYTRHGVSFETAIRVFDDVFAIERLDDREDYGEDRYSVLGMVDGRLLYVAFTVREGITRIISARGAEPHERRQYHEDNT
jgi:uncharacterized DUF497 family protein